MTGVSGSASPPTLGATLADLTLASWGYTAVAWAEETGLLYGLDGARTAASLADETGMPAPLVTGILDVLRALGLVRCDGEEWVPEPALTQGLAVMGGPALRGDLRANLLLMGCLAADARRGTPTVAWDHSDEVLLEAQGARSAALVRIWAEHLFPAMDDLTDRLGGGSASFLDVGSGVGAISVAMRRRYPALRCVGLDPLPAATKVARRLVADAGLEHAIELRQGRFEDVTDEEVFDLVQIPVMFIPVPALREGLARALAALRPGGWVLAQVMGRAGDELLPAVARLWCTMTGGEPLHAEDVAGLLDAAGFASVTVFPPLPGSPVFHVAGRRAGLRPVA